MATGLVPPYIVSLWESDYFPEDVCAVNSLMGQGLHAADCLPENVGEIRSECCTRKELRRKSYVQCWHLIKL